MNTVYTAKGGAWLISQILCLCFALFLAFLLIQYQMNIANGREWMAVLLWLFNLMPPLWMLGLTQRSRHWHWFWPVAQTLTSGLVSLLYYQAFYKEISIEREALLIAIPVIHLVVIGITAAVVSTLQLTVKRPRNTR